MNSWQDLLTNYKPQAPANFNSPQTLDLGTPQNILRTPSLPGVDIQRPWMGYPANQNRPPLGPYDSVKGVGDPRARQLSPAEMAGAPTTNDTPPWSIANKNRTPYQKLLNPDPDIEDIIAQRVAAIALRVLPPWVSGPLVGAGAIMRPTPTAPPEMDEAPPWSWPQQ